MKEINITGQKFNRLTALKKIIEDNKRNRKWLFKCECGNFVDIDKDTVIRGISKSCGCLRSEQIKKMATTHGFTKTHFYKKFRSIVERCNLKNQVSYKRYGGRGIKCLWKSFEEFKNDMYESYIGHCKEFGNKNTTIDRIDNNGNYCKENCRWATYKEQANNKNSNKFITFNGKTQSYADWEKELGYRRGIISDRIRGLGWDKERALTTRAPGHL